MDHLGYLLILTVFGAIFYLYRRATSNFSYFLNQGIPGPKPIPFVGNVWGIWKKNLPTHDLNLVKSYGKVFGYFEGNRPNLWITDAELIKSVYVTNFDCFKNLRDIDLNSKVARKFLTMVRDDEWEDIRASITPAFTAGKIQRYSVQIQDSAKRMGLKLIQIAQSQGKFNVEEVFSKFAMEVVGRTAFGMKVEKMEKTSEDPLFMQKARKVFSPRSARSPLVLLTLLPKRLIRFASPVYYTDELKLFGDLMDKRVHKRAARSFRQKFYDFPEIATESMMEYTKVVDGRTVPMWTREEINEIVAAQSTLFLVVGCRTISTALSCSSFLLARHPEVQEKLHREIEIKIKHYGSICPDLLNELHYTEQVIYEVLRMYPPILRTERGCYKDVTCNGIRFQKDSLVTVPIYALHHMEEYYPDPFTFNPERWSPENRKSMNPCHFMAFSLGPRNCLGQKLVMEEIKIALCTLVAQLRFFPVEETKMEIEFESGAIPIAALKDITIGIELRS